VGTLVDQAGHYILAGAGFAGDQHRNFCRSHLFDEKPNITNRLRVADETHCIPFLTGTVAEHGVFPRQLDPLVRLFHHQIKPIEIEGLADEITGPELHGLYGDIDIAMASDHDHFNMRDRLPDSDQQVEVRDIRQPNIHDDDVKPVGADQGHGLSTVGGGVDFATTVGQFLLQQSADRFLVINDEDGVGFFVHGCCIPGR
jgi:hypothetical protein